MNARISAGIVVVVSIASISPSARAAVVATFTDGSGTSSADQFQGIAGDGWTSAWGSPAGNVPTTSVTSASPINGSGNYLSVNPNGAGDGAIGRAFDGTGLNGGVNATLPVTISFDLRIDALGGWGANGDYITIHSSTGTGAYNVSGASSFIIRGYGASPATGKNGNEWLLYSGAGDGGTFAASNFVNSGMTIAPNTTYHFTVTSNPTMETYGVTISNGTTSVSSADLGWRANAGTGLQTNLAFNHRESSTADTFGYSIDNISIVPEPSTVLLGGLGMLALLRRRLA